MVVQVSRAGRTVGRNQDKYASEPAPALVREGEHKRYWLMADERVDRPEMKGYWEPYASGSYEYCKARQAERGGTIVGQEEDGPPK